VRRACRVVRAGCRCGRRECRDARLRCRVGDVSVAVGRDRIQHFVEERSRCCLGRRRNRNDEKRGHVLGPNDANQTQAFQFLDGALNGALVDIQQLCHLGGADPGRASLTIGMAFQDVIDSNSGGSDVARVVIDKAVFRNIKIGPTTTANYFPHCLSSPSDFQLWSLHSESAVSDPGLAIGKCQSTCVDGVEI
jgi:hypothetical protein